MRSFECILKTPVDLCTCLWSCDQISYSKSLIILDLSLNRVVISGPWLWLWPDLSTQYTMYHHEATRDNLRAPHSWSVLRHSLINDHPALRSSHLDTQWPPSGCRWQLSSWWLPSWALWTRILFPAAANTAPIRSAGTAAPTGQPKTHAAMISAWRVRGRCAAESLEGDWCQFLCFYLFFYIKCCRYGTCADGLMCSNCNRCQGCSFKTFICWDDRNCIW